MNLDSHRFPTAAEYLENLPNGLDSFPTCQIHWGVFETLNTNFPTIKDESSLPLRLRAILNQQEGPWFPEVAGNVLYLMVRDMHDNDEQFLDWNHKNIERLCGGPILRGLMAVLSTSLVAMGAARRWSSYHRGTEMIASAIEPQGERLVTMAKLNFPAGLFTPLMLQQHRSTFCAALQFARARVPEVMLADRTATAAIYRASWQR